MLNRCLLIAVVFAVASAALQSRIQAQDVSPGERLQKRGIRILVEGDESAIPLAIEEMRRSSRASDVRITFVSKSTDPYDARIILTFGTGKTWDNDPNIRPGDMRFPVPFAFGTAVALTPDGKTVFTVTQSGNTAQSASVAVAREIVRNLRAYAGLLTVSENSTDYLEHCSQKPVAPSQSMSSTGDSIPGEPGIYYKAPDGWVRLEQALPSAAEARGVATALLTAGVSGVRMIQAYSGAASHLQIREQRPTFYVRGFALSDQDVRIVRLEKKKDHREIVAASITPLNVKDGYRERDSNDVVVSRTSDVIAITPRTELKPGEYLLSFGRLELRYDFGIPIAKK